MKYITGIYALNLPSPDGTPGDWHFSALDWNKAKPAESSDSPFGEWGLHSAAVPAHGTMMVANHIRACLDLIAQGNYGTAQGMRNDFICDDRYTPVIFEMVMLLRDSPNWKDIDAFMGHEYLCKWLDYKKNVNVNMSLFDKEEHLSVIHRILDSINKRKDNPFVLKGGTALSMCYSLNRFSEDIDFDAPGLGVSHNRFKKDIRRFCEQNGFSFCMTKDTSTTQRAYVNYGNDGRPLKVEVSYRRKEIPDDLFCVRNGIKVYTIDEIAKIKAASYNGHNKIRDLYDVSYICTHYFDELSESARDFLRAALEYKDLDQFDYIVQTQHDELIDPDVLEDMFLESFDKLGLLSPLADRERMNNPSPEHVFGAEDRDHGISLKQGCEASRAASHDSDLNRTSDGHNEHGDEHER